MEKQKPQHINNFKKGDLITRVENYYTDSIFNEISGKWEKSICEAVTGVGAVFKYLGGLNGKIIVQYHEDYGRLKKGQIESYDYNRYQDGWTKYFDSSELGKTKGKLMGKEDVENIFEETIKFN